MVCLWGVYLPENLMAEGGVKVGGIPIERR
jgi:hypothetical protein